MRLIESCYVIRICLKNPNWNVKIQKASELAKIDKEAPYDTIKHLYCKWFIVSFGEIVAKLVVPKVRRVEILKLAHTSVLGGNHATKKTLKRSRAGIICIGMIW